MTSAALDRARMLARQPAGLGSSLLAGTASLLLVSSLACSDLEPVEPLESAQESPASPPAAAPAPAVATAPAERASVNAAGLVFDLPAGWQEVAPESPMRAAELRFAGSGGEGQLGVFHFGAGGGGGVEANLERWLSQLAGAGEPERQTLEVGALRVTWIEAAGTLKASRIGSFPPEDMPGYGLFGAVVEGTGGPWYVRAVGPEATMQEQRAGWLGLLGSVTGG